MATKINKKEAAEIARLKRNTQAKIRRLKKAGMNESQLPNINTKITNDMPRYEVNRIKEEMRSFTNRYNADYQYVKAGQDFIPKREIIEMQIAQKRVNAKELANYRRHLKNEMIIASERGSPTAARTVEQDRHKEPPLEYKRKEFKSRKDFEKYADTLNKRIDLYDTRDEQLRENIITGITTLYGEDEAADLIKRIRTMKIDKLIRLFETTDVFKNLLHFYRLSHLMEDNFADDLFSDIEYVMEGL